MGGQSTDKAAETQRAVAWKRSTTTLEDYARAAGVFSFENGAQSSPLDVCLPREHAVSNLLPDVRGNALDLFDELEIIWHGGGIRRPSNHLLSSQVQCVNALGRMVDDPDRIVRAFGDVVDIAEVVPIEPGRFLTFEYVGEFDYFSESPSGRRRRGSLCTSVDAAFVHRSSSGALELALIEWKYTESYEPKDAEPHKDATRRRRYGAALTAPDSPVWAALVPVEDLFAEPLYQLVRQQLLAHAIEVDHRTPLSKVRIIHVLSPANDGYQGSVHRASLQALGDTVDEVWDRLLRHPDRFVRFDPAAFLDPKITSPEYHLRYGGVNRGWS